MSCSFPEEAPEQLGFGQIGGFLDGVKECRKDCAVMWVCSSESANVQEIFYRK